jgi:hypothetical protein
VVELLFRPGFLTTEFLAGRRARQVPPLRFYLFVSILFFLTSSFGPSGDIFDIDDTPREASFEGFGFNPETTVRINPASVVNPEDNRELDPLERKARDFLLDKYNRREEIVQMIAENLPKLIFACLPVFALITRIVFRRAKIGYLSHLVMALHLHSFFFLFSLVSSGWEFLLGLVSPLLGGIAAFASVVYMFVYAFLAARRVFGASRAGTFWRSVLAAGLYLMALGIGPHEGHRAHL